MSSLDVDTAWGRAVERPIDEKRKEDTTGTCASITESVDVAIVGGGLVGLAVAIGLERVGISSQVYERAPQLRSNSQGILCIQPNGLRALEQIHPSIPTLVSEKGCQRLQRVITTIHKDGTSTDVLQETGKETMETYGVLKYGITWHNMQQVLASLLPPGRVATNHSLVSFEEEEDAVLLKFENGAVVRAKVVLACDGVFSVARRQIAPPLDSPIYFGQLNWGTIIETRKLPTDLHIPNAVHYFSYEGDPRWMSMINDGGNGYTFWQFRVADPNKAMALSGSRGRGELGLPGVKKGLLPVAKPSNKVYRAIENIPEEQIFERSIVGRSTLETWISPKGRVALVGDSAHGMHPNIGQGANSAFESANVLIDSMSKHHSDWQVALKEYETARKPRADVVQQFANMMGVSQSTGKEFVSRAEFEEMYDWILDSDSSKLPPKDILQKLETFDPCQEEGVSLLW